MNKILTYSNKTDKKTLLFIGFDGRFDDKISNFPYQSEEYGYKIINQPFKALRWLNEQVSGEEYLPPYAIFFHVEYLLEEGLQVLSTIKESPDLMFVPTIALASQDHALSAQKCLDYGMDDCYTFPADWNDVEQRIDFLNVYKPRIRSVLHTSSQNFTFKIPFLKRAMDITGASFLILMTSPIWIPVTIAIIIESGFPVIYRSKRAGTGYQVFDFLKFRSMWQDADKRKQELMEKNQYTDANGNPSVFFKMKNDPRITKVGRFIRKYSIDELPQFMNILKGDMSLVGNRPLPLDEAEMLTQDSWAGRFLAPAGLTGLWQVTKRGSDDMSMEERIALDLEYAQNWSILTDIKILFKTLTAFVQKENV